MRTKQSNANIYKIIKLGKPVNTGRINKTTGYKGVTKITYPTGTIRYAARIKYQGVGYCKMCKTALEAAQVYNTMAKKLYKRKAESLNILNVL